MPRLQLRESAAAGRQVPRKCPSAGHWKVRTISGEHLREGGCWASATPPLGGGARLSLPVRLRLRRSIRALVGGSFTVAHRRLGGGAKPRSDGRRPAFSSGPSAPARAHVLPRPSPAPEHRPRRTQIQHNRPLEGEGRCWKAMEDEVSGLRDRRGAVCLVRAPRRQISAFPCKYGLTRRVRSQRRGRRFKSDHLHHETPRSSRYEAFLLSAFRWMSPGSTQTGTVLQFRGGVAYHCWCRARGATGARGRGRVGRGGRARCGCRCVRRDADP